MSAKKIIPYNTCGGPTHGRTVVPQTAYPQCPPNSRLLPSIIFDVAGVPAGYGIGALDVISYGPAMTQVLKNGAAPVTLPGLKEIVINIQWPNALPQSFVNQVVRLEVNGKSITFGQLASETGKAFQSFYTSGSSQKVDPSVEGWTLRKDVKIEDIFVVGLVHIHDNVFRAEFQAF